MNKKEQTLIEQISQRAKRLLALCEEQRKQIEEDLVITHSHVCMLRLADLLSADILNFKHVLIGQRPCIA